jgi:WhiB family transcriptional regulator, redox-sensing transcriptional regulator
MGIFGAGVAYGFDTASAEHWSTKGACRGMDAELFFPLGGLGGQQRVGANLAQEQRAKAVCNTRPCPVRDECLAAAITNGDDHGIFGGLNERERRDLAPAKPETGRNFAAANKARASASTRWCQRCADPYEWDAERQFARLCPPCGNADAVRNRKRRVKAGAQ